MPNPRVCSMKRTSKMSESVPTSNVNEVDENNTIILVEEERDFREMMDQEDDGIAFDPIPLADYHNDRPLSESPMMSSFDVMLPTKSRCTVSPEHHQRTTEIEVPKPKIGGRMKNYRVLEPHQSTSSGKRRRVSDTEKRLRQTEQTMMDFLPPRSSIPTYSSSSKACRSSRSLKKDEKKDDEAEAEDLHLLYMETLKLLLTSMRRTESSRREILSQIEYLPQLYSPFHNGMLAETDIGCFMDSRQSAEPAREFIYSELGRIEAKNEDHYHKSDDRYGRTGEQYYIPEEHHYRSNHY